MNRGLNAPGSPAQVWMGAVLVTTSGLRIVVTALPMIRLNIPPTPIGLNSNPWQERKLYLILRHPPKHICRPGMGASVFISPIPLS